MFNFATIKSKFEFKKTCQKGLNFKGKYFVLKFIPEDTTKIGFIITKKVGNSVVRNRIRRRLRAMISNATNLNLLAVKGNYVLIARPNIFYDKYEVIDQNFKKILLEVKESANQ